MGAGHSEVVAKQKTVDGLPSFHRCSIEVVNVDIGFVFEEILPKLCFFSLPGNEDGHFPSSFRFNIFE